MSQKLMMLELFRRNGNVLTTADFAADRKLSCEYRRILCDLKRDGFFYTAKPIAKNLWKYELVEPEGQQMRFA